MSEPSFSTPSSTSSFHIRPLTSVEEFQEAEAVQYAAWNMHDYLQVIPVHVLLTAQKNGGLVAGAFDNTDRMVGVLFGFLGMSHDGKLKHCSHIMGVRPEVRRQNVGQLLKLFQREYVINQGLDLITWTYDPLEGVNASLNIARLGAVSYHYYLNMYGNSMADSLNVGLPTDRFEVEWWINSQHVKQHLAERAPVTYRSLLINGAQIINGADLDNDGMIRPFDVNLTLDQDSAVDTLLLEVPAEFQAIKVVSMELANEWRTLTRNAFVHYFTHNFVVTDFITDREDGYRRNFYILSRRAKIMDW